MNWELVVCSTESLNVAQQSWQVGTPTSWFLWSSEFSEVPASQRGEHIADNSQLPP